MKICILVYYTDTVKVLKLTKIRFNSPIKSSYTYT